MAVEDKDLVGLTEEELLSLTDGQGQEDVNPDPDPVSDEQEQEQPEEPFVPVYVAEQPEDINQRLADMSANHDEILDGLAEQYENGDIDFRDYQKQLRETNRKFADEREELVKASLKAEIAQEQAQQSAAQKWQWEQDQFFAENKAFKSDPVLYGALEAAYLTLANSGDTGNKTSIQLLREAADTVRSKFNIAQPVDAKKPEPRKPVKADIPKTLADLPAADSNTETGEFDYMDKLDGMDFEKALARMTEEQRERYMAS